ncbi:MAG: hypothetical protein JST27_12260 [Bacteroidetes bacterium]|nr:hypothetical protein [Bacteroidota bacterium]
MQLSPNIQLTGNGLIVFSDPAGTKACLALAALLQREQPELLVSAYSNKEYDFYSHWHTHVNVVESLDLNILPYRPDWIFTGTSFPTSSACFEIKAVAQAKTMNIPVYSFVDHWTNMRLRFELQHSLVLPDRIFVLDETAKKIAIQSGLPAETLAILQNPYLTYIAKCWRPELSSLEILEAAGSIHPTGSYILYAPDPISLRNQDGKWGFDECSALRDIASAWPKSTDATLVVKAHPLQPMGPILQVAKQAANTNNIQILFAPPVDNLELAHAAALVIGMHSNFLIEAAALGKCPVRYFPNSDELDAIAHLDIGIKVSSIDGLRKEINKFIL